uniref:Uncharacterized protein n=1 Tax=Cannabis sativa TaxID=3483 RepID=A0A803QPI4_CANSA
MAEVSQANQHRIQQFKSRFQFEKLWLKDDDCLQLISRFWKNSTASDPTSQTLNNISICASQLQAWHRGIFGDLPRKIKSSDQNVAALQNSNNTDHEHFVEFQISENILDELLAQEEDY